MIFIPCTIINRSKARALIVVCIFHTAECGICTPVWRYLLINFLHFNNVEPAGITGNRHFWGHQDHVLRLQLEKVLIKIRALQP